MGRGGNKLTKLKSVLKKLNSFGQHNKHQAINSTPSFASSTSNNSDTDDSSSSSSSADLRPVYVGQSRRRYLVNSAVVHHPLFRELAARSGNSAPSSDADDSSSLNIACEVVLFEHLLWMLENAESRPEPLDELVEFYAY
ncbi:hypothetical protein EUGRSUZ_C03202 [Eucalyptus grandis]|uniref:Uncharacterized protein n=2 Tax=Eucalyptus grandis TaxID=71139 RepID=A0A059CUJ7_EUCGR|nr:hypothetical protein EUGRSUZ_C03202 [Eucalyptus grandis]